MNAVDVDFEELLGKTLYGIEIKGKEEIVFTTTDGARYRLNHYQECCESVTIDDICGDLTDLIGAQLVEAEEVTSRQKPADVELTGLAESFTWTFYKLRTAKGCVTIRWHGESTGNYSESVGLERVA